MGGRPLAGEKPLHEIVMRHANAPTLICRATLARSPGLACVGTTRPSGWPAPRRRPVLSTSEMVPLPCLANGDDALDVNDIRPMGAQGHGWIDATLCCRGVTDPHPPPVSDIVRVATDETHRHGP